MKFPERMRHGRRKYERRVTLPDGAPRYWLKHTYLSPWLRVAMKGLTTEARARIREEIEAHFDDAVDVHLSSGFAAKAAAEKAVESLGSARAACRAFRRTYLTTWQGETLRHLTEKRASFVYGWLGVGPALLTTFVARGVGWDWFKLTIVVLMPIAAFVRVVAVPYFFRRGHERTGTGLGGCAELLLWSGVTMSDHRVTELERWFLLVLLIVLAFTYLPLLPKLSNHRPRQARPARKTS